MEFNPEIIQENLVKKYKQEKDVKNELLELHKHIIEIFPKAVVTNIIADKHSIRVNLEYEITNID